MPGRMPKPDFGWSCSALRTVPVRLAKAHPQIRELHKALPPDPPWPFKPINKSQSGKGGPHSPLCGWPKPTLRSGNSTKLSPTRSSVALQAHRRESVIGQAEERQGVPVPSRFPWPAAQRTVRTTFSPREADYTVSRTALTQHHFWDLRSRTLATDQTLPRPQRRIKLGPRRVNQRFRRFVLLQHREHRGTGAAHQRPRHLRPA
jgi:hypothetical protein